jgi:transposase
MSRTLRIQAYMTVDELGQQYRQARDPIVRSHWQILWLLVQGRPTAEVAQVTGYSVGWVRQLVGRYNQHGPAGLGDERHHNPGRPPVLSPEQEAALEQALDGLAPDGGQWTGPKVAAWISAQIGRPVRPQLGWDYCQRLQFRLKVPRPHHALADAQAQEDFVKKNSPTS